MTDSAAQPGRARVLAAWALVATTVFSCRLATANGIFVLGVVPLVLAWRSGQLAGRPWGRQIMAPAFAFFLASIVAVTFSLDPLNSVVDLRRFFFWLLLPAGALLLEGKWWERLLIGLAAQTSLLAVWGIVQYAIGPRDLEHRIQGPMAHYMLYSGWLLLIVLVLIAEAVLGPRRRLVWLGPAIGLGLTALLLTYTRNAWVGLVVGLLLLAAVWRRRLLVAYPVLAAIIWLAAPKPVIDRMISTFDLRQHSNYDRLCMVISGVQMVRDRPWTGVGPEMVERLYPLYRRDDAPRWHVPHLHDNPMQIAAERGLPGLAAYLWLIGAFFVVTWRGLRDMTGPPRSAVAACFVALAGITVAGLFENNFAQAVIQYPTLVLMGAGVGRVESGE